MKKLFKASLLTGAMMLSFASINVQAAEPTDESLQKLAEIFELDEFANQSLASDPEMLEDFVKKSFVNMPLTGEYKKVYEQIVVRYLKELTEYTNTPENRQIIINSYISALKTNYDQEEIDAQIEFYSTDIGKRIMSKQDAFNEDYLEGVSSTIYAQQAEFMQQMMPKMMMELMQAFEEIE